MVDMRLEGDWDFVNRVLAQGRRMPDAVRNVFRHEAEMLKKEVVKGLDNQVAAGRKISPLARATLAARSLTGVGGSKALIASGALRNGIQVWKSAAGWTLGLTGPHAHLGKMIEQGLTRVIRMTEQQRRWFFANIGRSNPEDTYPPKGGGDTIVQKIPPRPFFTPVVEKFMKDSGMPRRIMRSAAQLVGSDFYRAFFGG